MSAQLTPQIIEAAIAGFESQKSKIDQQMQELRALLRVGRTASASTSAKAARRKRVLSPEAIERIRQGQLRRWAEARGEQPEASAAAPKPKRKLSAAGRRAISEATKRRWALKRAEAATAHTPAVKKSAPSTKKRAVKKVAKKTASANATRRAAVRRAVTKETASKPPVQTAPVATPAPTATEETIN